jgi:hypothetical protein
MIANPAITVRESAISSRMPKTTTLEIVSSDDPILQKLTPEQIAALKQTLPVEAAQIRATQDSAKRHAKLAIAFAVRQGLLCEEAKKKLPHGQYEPWLAVHDIGKMTAHRDRLLAKSSTMEDLNTKALMAPDFVERIETDRKFRAELADKVQEVAGESTLTELMRDLGIIRTPANVNADTGKRKYYPPAPKPKNKTPEQVAKENRAATRKMFINAFAAVKSATNNKQARRFLLATDWVFIGKLAKDHVDALNKIAAQAQAALAKGAK